MAITKNSKAAQAAWNTRDAYMADTYGDAWQAAAKVILSLVGEDKTNSREIARTEYVLRSKYMRWADDVEGRGAGKRANGAAVRRYLSNPRVMAGVWEMLAEEGLA